ncbi:MAG: hypothetical protein AAGK02_02100 [Pseudomonadota bacterium]
MKVIRTSIAAAAAISAALTLPAQNANASVGDNGDRAASGPVCLWESKLAAEQKDMNRGTCFTPGMHEDAYHVFYNRMGERYVEYVTVADGHAADLFFTTSAHGETDRVSFRGSRQLPTGRTGLANIYVHSTEIGRAHKEAKACFYKDKGWYELYRRAYARCFPTGAYPDVSLPQFDAKGWFKYAELASKYRVTLYTGKNFTGSSMVVSRNGKIVPPKPPRPGRADRPEWLERTFPGKINSIKVERIR